jgi:hypothetical protein
MAPEVGGELVPGDSVWSGMSGSIRIPPSGCRPLKSSCSIQDLLSVITLTGSEHLQASALSLANPQLQADQRHE